MSKEKENKKGYPWPASALTKNEMAILAGWREETGIPITKLLKETVVELDRIRTAGKICQDIKISGGAKEGWSQSLFNQVNRSIMLRGGQAKGKVRDFLEREVNVE
ncbi:MAG: hypothetical protein JRI26_11780 [Deltaproteobacteria bacterium]|nr:hypothetical protein [Deltaproteobacteria bacterium]